jgi:hypothetical protein
MRKAVVDYKHSGPLEQAIGKVTIIPGNINSGLAGKKLIFQRNMLLGCKWSW